MKQKITDAFIRRLPLPTDGRQRIVHDTVCVGLGLRLGASSRTWTVIYRPRGMPRTAPPKKMTLGRWPTVNCGHARRLARVALGSVAGGGDPSAERREAKRKEQAKLATVLDKFEASLLDRGYVNRATTMSTLRRGLASMLYRDIG